MITVSLEVFVLTYLAVGLSLIFGLWIFYDLRDRHMYGAERSKIVFYCVKCGRLYSGKKGIEVQECPQCNFSNARLKF